MLNRFILRREGKRTRIWPDANTLTIVALDVEIRAPAFVVGKLVWMGFDNVALVRCSRVAHTLSEYHCHANQAECFRRAVMVTRACSIAEGVETFGV